jgi:hypothetical protein
MGVYYVFHNKQAQAGPFFFAIDLIVLIENHIMVFDFDA